MKKSTKIVLYIIVVTVLLSQMSFTFQNEDWLNSESYIQDKDGYIDRGGVCEYLVKAYIQETGKKPGNAKNFFSDLNKKEYPYALKAYSLGLINGTEETLFSPKSIVTRGDMAVIILRLVKTINPEAYVIGGEDISFPDQVNEWQLEALRFAFSRGITTGRNFEIIAANDNLTTGEAADMIERTLAAAPDYNIVYPTFKIKKAYLTFDDTASSNTYKIMDVLDEHNAKATFFLNGETNAELLIRMRDSGHTIGNHTYSHNYKSIYKDPRAFWEDFDREQKHLENILGYSPALIRFPGGSNNTVSHNYGGKKIMHTLTAQANEYGYIYFDWNVSSGDANGSNIPKEQLIASVLEGSRGKESAIILMHHNASKSTTAEALPEIISGLKEMGFVFLPLTENSVRIQFLK